MKKITRKKFIKTGLCFYAAMHLSPLLQGCVPREELKELEPTSKDRNITDEQIPNNMEEIDIAVSTGKNLKNNVRNAIEALGGIDRFVLKGDKVVVKPNILYAAKPKYAATTNPLVIEELVSLCYKAGASEVIVLDRPTSGTGIAYKTTGIESATRRAGGRTKILSNRNFIEKDFPQGKILKNWPLVKDIFEADVFINVPIAKHHNLSVLTLSMKNLMGTMGGWRSFMHTDFPTKIVDLNTLVKPDLIILDAYKVLYRNGPTGGNLDDVKNVYKVIAGTDAVKIDSWATTLFGLKPEDLDFLVEAKNREIGNIDINKYKIREVK